MDRLEDGRGVMLQIARGGTARGNRKIALNDAIHDRDMCFS